MATKALRRHHTTLNRESAAKVFVIELTLSILPDHSSYQIML